MPIPASSSHRLLIVDDDPLTVQVLGGLLSGQGELRFALNGTAAQQMAAQWQPDLILLDAGLPDIDGLSLCRRFKADALLAPVPVIVITSLDDVASEIAALEAGAADFIRKPPQPPVVLARVRTQLRLKQLADVLRRQATMDGLTGVTNRRGFDEALARECGRARRSGQPLSLAMVDVDHFKRYNDHHGHPAGDRVLCQVARTLAGVAQRRADLLARYGGEEFALLLPETPLPGAQRVGQALCDAVAALALPHGAAGAAPLLSVSVGVACVEVAALAVEVAVSADAAESVLAPGEADAAGPADADSLGLRLLQAADSALYRAKQGGRGRVQAAPLLRPGRRAAVSLRRG